jgi:DNA-binding LacI/PurR family transcriptional regulator
LFHDRLSYAFADPAAVMFLEGVSEAMEEAGLGLLLLPGRSLGDRDPEAIRGAAVDGVVLYSMAGDDPLVGAVLERRLPAVIVDQLAVEGVPSVGIDDEGAARAAAEHLIELGHRRLGVVSFRLTLEARSGMVAPDRREGATLRASGARLRGCAAAVGAADISWDEVPVYECVESTPAEGQAAAEALLSREPLPTAILALSDQLAFGVIEAATEMGLSVPEGLSVVGFDDVPEAARSTPPLTTLHQPHVEKGLCAGRKLVAQLREEDPGGSELLLPTRLVVRGSTSRAS